MTAIKAGDRTEVAYTTVRGTVLAVDGDAAWILDDDGNRTTYPIKNLTLIPPKIAEPGVGSVVWDDGVPWMRLTDYSTGWNWLRPVDGHQTSRQWDDFSDAVTLATPPEVK